MVKVGCCPFIVNTINRGEQLIGGTIVVCADNREQYYELSSKIGRLCRALNEDTEELGDSDEQQTQ